MGDLEKLISDTVAKIVGEKKDITDETPKSGTNIAEVVREQIQFLKSREKKEAEEADLKKSVDDLKKAATEQAPVERRRVHKLMGWGENK